MPLMSTSLGEFHSSEMVPSLGLWVSLARQGRSGHHQDHEGDLGSEGCLRLAVLQGREGRGFSCGCTCIVALNWLGMG